MTVRRTLPLVVLASMACAVAPLAAQPASTNPVSAFRTSFELSLDGVHWSKSLTAPFPYRCQSSRSSLCGSRTPDVRIHTRWAPLPTVNMAQVHIAGMNGAYRIDLSPPRAKSVCESGASYPLSTSGIPVTIRASRPGGPFPITCTWVVSAVVAGATGSSPPYELVQSNPASVTLTLAR